MYSIIGVESGFVVSIFTASFTTGCASESNPARLIGNSKLEYPDMLNPDMESIRVPVTVLFA